MKITFGKAVDYHAGDKLALALNLDKAAEHEYLRFIHAQEQEDVVPVE